MPTSDTSDDPFTVSVTELIHGGRKRRTACGAGSPRQPLPAKVRPIALAGIRLAGRDRLDRPARDLADMGRLERDQREITAGSGCMFRPAKGSR